MSLARTRIEFRAEPDWLARVRTTARRLGLSLSAFIRLVVSREIGPDQETGLRRLPDNLSTTNPCSHSPRDTEVAQCLLQPSRTNP